MTRIKKMLGRITIVLFVINIAFTSTKTIAQSAVALYLTASAYVQNKPSFNKEWDNKCKIRFHNSPSKSFVKVSCKDSTYLLNKDSVFGFIDGSNNINRFFNREIYTIINPGETILLYKVILSNKTKYEEITYSYYYSKDANSPIYALKISNVERSFKNNKIFIDFLEVHFKTDDELLEYDTNNKKFKINQLLELSISKN